MNTDVKTIKKLYQPGQRIRLIHMADPIAPVPDGTEGVVRYVDDAGQIQMKWDNGRSLALVPKVDRFEKI